MFLCRVIIGYKLINIKIVIMIGYNLWYCINFFSFRLIAIIFYKNVKLSNNYTIGIYYLHIKVKSKRLIEMYALKKKLTEFDKKQLRTFQFKQNKNGR